jgi:hypothetical protein
MAFGDNLNTFKVLQTMKGRVTRGLEASLDMVDARTNPSSSFDNFYYSDWVTLISNGTDAQIMIDEIASTSDIPYGMILYNKRKNTYLAGETVPIIRENSYVAVQAGGAITAGNELEWDYTNKVVVVKSTGKKIGIAQQDAALNDIFEMQIKF